MVALVVAVLGCAVLCGALISPHAQGKRSRWASWRLALQPIGGRGEGKGAFVGYVGYMGWGWGQTKPRTKSAEQQQAGSRDRGGPGSWQLAKKIWHQYSSQY